MKRLYFAILAIVFGLSISGGLTSTAQAAPKPAATPCRDAAGKFTKCKAPAPTPKPKATPCRDKNGKFVKCTPMATPKPKATPCRDKSGKFIKCK
jgi:hypothetical protein